MTDQNPVAVIGGGLGGLAAAAVLAARGHAVTLFDKNPWLGGKAAVLEAEGFRFDMGPTILTVPMVLERIFAEAGERLADRLDLIRLDPQWRCFFEDGATLDLVEDVEAMTRRLDGFAPGQNLGAGYRRFQGLAERLNQISERFFFWRSVEDLRDTLDLRRNFSPGTLADVMALRMGQSVAGVIRRHLPEKRVAQMLDHFTQYVGSSPFAAPAVLCAIAHMQASGGVWYPRGGTRAVATALTALAERHGARLMPGVEVTGLDIERGTVRAIRTADGARHPASAVVSNMDSSAPTANSSAAKRARARSSANTSRPARAWCSTSASRKPTTTSCTTISCSRATPRRSSTSSTAAASPRLIRPATWRPPRAPTRRSPHPAARRSISWSTRPIFARTTTGAACYRPTGGRSSTR